MKEKTFLSLIVLAGALLFFTFLGTADLWNPDEPRDAEIAREMRLSKNFVVPTLNGKTFLEKPPLFYWLVNLAAPREVTETSARAPSAFFAVLGMLLAFYTGKNVYDKKTGLFSALLLPCFFQYWWMGRRASLDMTFSFFVTASIFFFYKSYFTAKDKRRYFLLFYLCGSLAVLTKGLLGIMLIGVVVFSFLAVQRNLKFIFSWHLTAGLLLFVCIFSSWVYFLWKQGGMGHLHTFFVVNHLQRFAGKFGGHNQPIYYYAQTLVLDFLPWSIFLPFLISYIKNAPQCLTDEKKPKFHFMLCWIFAILTLLSLSKSKREIYLLPLYVPLAVLYAGAFAQIHGRRLFSSMKIVRGFSTLFAVLPVLTASAVIAAKVIVSANAGFALLLIFPALAVFIMVKIINTGSFLALVHFCTGFILLVFFSAPPALFSGLNAFLSVKPFASAFRSQSAFYDLNPDAARLYMFNIPEGMQGAYLFYFKRAMPLIQDDERGMLERSSQKAFTCFLMKKQDHDALGSRLTPYLFPFIISESRGQRASVLACNRKLNTVTIHDGIIADE